MNRHHGPGDDANRTVTKLALPGIPDPDEPDDAGRNDEEPKRAKPLLRAGSAHTPTSVWKRRASPSREAAGNSGPLGLAEWHALDPDARSGAWAGLRVWVTWLHDRYELGREERLPVCWAEHPGLIEELAALKAWREEIYAAGRPSGQAARYWHAELRQTVHAALSFYAAGCRAGHRGATTTADGNTALQDRWAAADPAVGIPPAFLAPAGPRHGNRFDTYLYMSAETMAALTEAGDARPLSSGVTAARRFDSSWWRQIGDGWSRIVEDDLDRRLHRQAQLLAAADTSAARYRPADRTPPTLNTSP